jgi:D-alanine-D-alanine ligase
VLASADDQARLCALEAALRRCGEDLALFLVYERPSQVEERPALARTYFAQRCVSDTQLDQMVDAFRSIGAYVELFDGELPFLRALADGLLERIDRRLPVVYNGIGFGITPGGFQPGRMALIPSVADSYGLTCANSDAYTCAFALHKFHSFVVLRALGVAAPPVWHFRPIRGWMGESPPVGTKVIAKSTYEAWSVGVTDDSVFVVDGDCEQRVATIAESIGQPVTVQEFVAGREVCVPILAIPDHIVTPPVEQILAKAPGDADAVMTIADNLSHGAVTYIPFDGPATLVDEMRRTSLAVFDILQIQALGRMDFRIDTDGRAWLTDAAITPGLSTASSAFASLAQFGFDHPSFLRVAVAASLGARGLLPDG